MAEEKNESASSGIEKPAIKASKMTKGRKTIAYLQQLKDDGIPIVQMCPVNRDAYFVMAAEMAGVDICRLTSPGEHVEHQIANASWRIREVRSKANIIHINFFMQTPTYVTNEEALKNGSIYMCNGADSLLLQGLKNEMCKFMSDNYLVLFGHVGAISGWQTAKFGGYKRHGKTAEDALAVYRQAYEYQENGMMAMTIELTPIEVTNAIAKKLRVPVINIAAGGAADGSEMVDLDTFNMMPSLASHAKAYADFFEWAVGAYSAWAEDVRTGGYPADEHGWHMDPQELEIFLDKLDKL